MREKAILVGETDEGDADGWGDCGYSTEWDLKGKVCSIMFRFWFSDLIQGLHDSKDGLEEDAAWRHGTYRCTTSSLKAE